MTIAACSKPTKVSFRPRRAGCPMIVDRSCPRAGGSDPQSPSRAGCRRAKRIFRRWRGGCGQLGRGGDLHSTTRCQKSIVRRNTPWKNLLYRIRKLVSKARPDGTPARTESAPKADRECPGSPPEERSSEIARPARDRRSLRPRDTTASPTTRREAHRGVRGVAPPGIARHVRQHGHGNGYSQLK